MSDNAAAKKRIRFIRLVGAGIITAFLGAAIGLDLARRFEIYDYPYRLFPAKPLDAAKARLEALGEMTLPLPEARIIVRKDRRRLEIYSGDRLVAWYRVALGGAPIGTKRVEGDQKTPEGNYYLCTRLNPSQFHLFLGISYPGPWDIAADSDVDQDEINAIKDAHDQRVQPPWSTSLGGMVGLHGGGTGQDWTLGCIAVDNNDIEELYLMTELGTPIEILE